MVVNIKIMLENTGFSTCNKQKLLFSLMLFYYFYGICYTWGMELHQIKEAKNQASIDTPGLLKSNCN